MNVFDVICKKGSHLPRKFSNFYVFSTNNSFLYRFIDAKTTIYKKSGNSGGIHDIHDVKFNTEVPKKDRVPCHQFYRKNSIVVQTPGLFGCFRTKHEVMNIMNSIMSSKVAF